MLQLLFQKTKWFPSENGLHHITAFQSLRYCRDVEHLFAGIIPELQATRLQTYACLIMPAVDQAAS